ncbi:MAG: transporter substrate-binding domain-containing protein [Marivivens sp.]|nr:transporter substrate-binding domain-containing protein [Marivivens sp.]
MRILVFILMSIFYLGQSSAEQLWIVSEEIPPYNYLENGEPQGLGSDLAQALLDETGRKAEVKILPWARSYHLALTRPSTLIHGMLRTPDREDQFAWVGAGGSYSASFYKLAENDEIDLSNVLDAKDLTIGVYIGDGKAEVLADLGLTQFEYAEVDHLNLRKLLLGRIDLMVVDDLVMSDLVRSEGVDASLIAKELQIPQLSGDTYLAFQKNTDPALVAEFRQALEKIRTNGVFDAILQRHHTF